ncbi:hypothetical protein FOA52_014225 [Chlamydomonas sp. UWO 241]|nr:hypothetical protein FOA52_014225 [Chlamydomonas sp. UWO 241]
MDGEMEPMVMLKKQLMDENAYDEEKHDEHALRRFLGARNNDVELAKAMWLAHQEWRITFKADAMLDSPALTPERKRRLIELFPHGLHGVDLEGRPVLIYRLGITQLSKTLKEFDVPTLQRCHVQLFEFIMRVAMPAASLRAGRHIDKLTMLFDIQGLSMFSMNQMKALLVPTMNITRDNYPETMGQVIIINAPAIFNGAWEVGRRMLTADTQRKIQVTGRSYMDTLLKCIDLTQVPECLNGLSKAALIENFGPWQELIDKKSIEERSRPGAASGLSSRQTSLPPPAASGTASSDLPTQMHSPTYNSTGGADAGGRRTSLSSPATPGALGTSYMQALNTHMGDRLTRGASTDGAAALGGHGGAHGAAGLRSRASMPLWSGGPSGASPRTSDNNNHAGAQPHHYSGGHVALDHAGGHQYQQGSLASGRMSKATSLNGGSDEGRIEDEPHMSRFSQASYYTCISFAETSHLASYLSSGTHVFAHHMPELAEADPSIRGTDGDGRGSQRGSKGPAGCRSRPTGCATCFEGCCGASRRPKG